MRIAGNPMSEVSTHSAVFPGKGQSVESENLPVEPPSQRSRTWNRISLALVVLVVLLALAAGIASSSLADTSLRRDFGWIAAVVIFASSYAALAIGRIPGLALDRAGIALVGAALIVACGALPLDQAYTAIDFDTLTLLLGMMIVVAHLRLSGFLSRATVFITRRAHRPLALLAAITAIAGVLSAFLVNDSICLVLTPLVIELARSSRRNPVPYLLAVAMASNVGSTATITGNPQNMMIGSLSHIPYPDFTAALAPVAVIGLVLTVMLIALFHSGEFAGGKPLEPSLPPAAVDRATGFRALAGTAILLVLLFLGQPPAKAAIVIGALLLLTRRVTSDRVYAEIDWSLLLMFAGLFIIVASAERTLLNGTLEVVVASLRLDRVPVLSGLTALLSNVVSNVPAVLLLKPFVVALPDQRSAWLTVGMASTLAGNFTVIGSIANLIVVQGATANGIEIGFWDYFKVGAPLTLLTLIIGTLWLWL
jgi:Na+/H+ antiporter NhaD/arsenite permease-like protein